MSSEPDEFDLSLIHALQIDTRVPWRKLAPVLRTTPVRLARRWQALSDSGAAWITAYENPMGTDSHAAIAELHCGVDSLEAICALLLQDDRVVSIEQGTQGGHLLLTLTATTFDELTHLLVEKLPSLDGVESIRTHVSAKTHYEAGRWRLGALESEQVNGVISLASNAPSGVPAVEAIPADFRDDLIHELRRDGRASAAELAAKLDRPVSTVRRHLNALLRSKAVVLRCECAQRETGSPTTVWWWCRAPVKQHRTIVESVVRRPELRLCMSITGPANLLVCMWVPSLAHMLKIQGWMETEFPSLEILENALILRTRKRLGWELDRRGYAVASRP